MHVARQVPSIYILVRRCRISKLQQLAHTVNHMANDLAMVIKSIKWINGQLQGCSKAKHCDILDQNLNLQVPDQCWPQARSILFDNMIDQYIICNNGNTAIVHMASPKAVRLFGPSSPSQLFNCWGSGHTLCTFS